MTTRALIICAGDATRWGNYQGTPKHLIEIEGERLLDRTVRLLRENGIHEIFTVVKEITPGYESVGAIQHAANLRSENADADKFLSSKELWSQVGRTIVIYGDCYFTDEAMRRIVQFESDEWTLFCRPTPSRITGTPWGECFAQSFYPKDLKQHEANLHRIAGLRKAKKIGRCGGWEHYSAMVGRPDDQIYGPYVMSTNYVIIDDWTDDFDYPKDYDKWIERRMKSLP